MAHTDNIIKLCVSGAAGRMGREVINAALSDIRFRIIAAFDAPDSESHGKTLRESGIAPLDIKLISSRDLKYMEEMPDICISFSNPKAEYENILLFSEHIKGFVIGTTGLGNTEEGIWQEIIKNNGMAVISSNFSTGINVFHNIIPILSGFGEEYDFSMIEAHHRRKMDSPGGTALDIAKLIKKQRNYSKTITGREGQGLRNKEEIEVFAVRNGSIPGIHRLIISGNDEMFVIEHTAFSRKVFATGALDAAYWLYNNGKSQKIYTMEDVINNHYKKGIVLENQSSVQNTIINSEIKNENDMEGVE